MSDPEVNQNEDEDEEETLPLPSIDDLPDDCSPSDLRFLLKKSYIAKERTKPEPDFRDENLLNLTKNQIISFIKSLHEIKDIEEASNILKSSNLSDKFSAHVNLQIPQVAPELWKKDDEEQSPINFIKEVYGNWIGDSLTLTHLSKLDKDLAISYLEWVKKNPTDTLNLPKHKKNNYPNGFVTTSKAPSFWKPVSDLTPEELEARREYEAIRKRRQRAQNTLT